jgi:ABC-type antimicrobial peptide transport system, permease component
MMLSALGIGFAVVLMFSQIGFLNGLFDSAVEVLRLLDTDLVILSPARYTVPSEQRFEYGLIDRAKGVQGVQAAIPMYIDRSLAQARVIGHVSRSIRVIGFPKDSKPFIDPEMNRLLEQLSDASMALVDRRSKDTYGFEKRSVERLRAQAAELSGKQVLLRDWVRIGTDFVYDGTLLISEGGVEYFFPGRAGSSVVEAFRRPPLSAVDLGLIRLEPHADPERVARDLQARLGSGIEVFTKKQLIAREIGFWARNTPIGIIFSIGTIMGLVIGVIICYQILFTDIQDHMAEYATLKAMGYGSGYFLRFVLSQAFYLCLFGFLPGWLVSWLLYQWLSEWTGLVMRLDTGRVLLVAALTLVMSGLSGILAVRKLWRSDPAALFK